jgi:hypothetical protein
MSVESLNIESLGGVEEFPVFEWYLGVVANLFTLLHIDQAGFDSAPQLLSLIGNAAISRVAHSSIAMYSRNCSQVAGHKTMHTAVTDSPFSGPHGTPCATLPTIPVGVETAVVIP